MGYNFFSIAIIFSCSNIAYNVFGYSYGVNFFSTILFTRYSKGVDKNASVWEADGRLRAIGACHTFAL
jgi:hypothetical protein